jgi:hypothetical protein
VKCSGHARAIFVLIEKEPKAFQGEKSVILFSSQRCKKCNRKTFGAKILAPNCARFAQKRKIQKPALPKLLHKNIQTCFSKKKWPVFCIETLYAKRDHRLCRQAS